ncbi:DELTA-actitoxin-Aas1a-like [Thunnus albacares]|uniref:DELTA-actitoxin-Aas1a-like n=1 Tax=Thunnus albacares TaxID=8236 RepID=UPI001CF709A0|nr:DELTA-actitoxin-Aas1a-like [Thunnus albacares]
MAGYLEAAVTVGDAIAGVAPTHRQCTIEIKNDGKFSLCNPRTHIERGSCVIPLPPFIASSKCGAAQFSKTAHTACGSVGVFTYDVLEKDKDQPTEKIAVMFSVPYDFNMYSNWYAVGIFEKSKECDHDLYYDMYYNTSPSFVRGEAKGPSLSHKGNCVKIMATMSDSYQPIIKVQVMDSVTK